MGLSSFSLFLHNFALIQTPPLVFLQLQYCLFFIPSTYISRATRCPIIFGGRSHFRVFPYPLSYPQFARIFMMKYGPGPDFSCGNPPISLRVCLWNHLRVTGLVFPFRTSSCLELLFPCVRLQRSVHCLPKDLIRGVVPFD